MTKAQVAALVVATGAGFTGGASFKALAGRDASVVFFHALRIEVVPSADGGNNDMVVGYRTRATIDAGAEDLGPARCHGDTRALKAAVTSTCLLPDAGRLPYSRVLEFRPSAALDGGFIAVDAYTRAGEVKCLLPKSSVFRNFLESLSCADQLPVSVASPL